MRTRVLLMCAFVAVVAAVALVQSSFTFGRTVEADVEAAVAAHQGAWTEADLRAAPGGRGLVASAVPTPDGGVLVVQLSTSSSRVGGSSSSTSSSSRIYKTRCAQYTITGSTLRVRTYVSKGFIPSSARC